MLVRNGHSFLCKALFLAYLVQSHFKKGKVLLVLVFRLCIYFIIFNPVVIPFHELYALESLCVKMLYLEAGVLCAE